MVARAPHLRFSSIPEASGLYDPVFDSDACGVAMVATLRGTAGHDIVNLALTALKNMEHRGAVGSDAGTGDGAGIMTQVPDEFFRSSVGFTLPSAGHYAAGSVFLPTDLGERTRAIQRIESLVKSQGLSLLGWRKVPTDPSVLGTLARETMPVIEQLFLTGPDSGIALDRRVYRLRKQAEKELEVYFPSLSSRTLVYKAMVTTEQLDAFYADLTDPRFASRLALVHSRFSTNTFPAWALAQPFRLVAHNGEINTVQGNRNWMMARQSQLHSDLLGDITPLLPIVSPGGSDSASFDEVLELLTLAGRSLPHAMMMMVPEAYENQPDMPEDRQSFYEYHSGLMEPWDGPAAMVFSDGSLVGATLDRNGLRPGRYLVTDDGLVVLASESGVLEIDPGRIVQKGRLRPGRMFLVDTDAGRIIDDDEIKQSLAQAQPWGEWVTQGRINLRDLPEREHIMHTPASVGRRQRTFGYTEEELRLLIAPMAQSGTEPLGAMGTDTPIAVLAKRPRLLFDYFTQQFAQVTNPPLDSIREAVVTSMKLGLGPELNLLEATPEHAYQIILDFPVINNDELAKIQHIDASPGSRTTTTIRGLYRVDDGPRAMADRLAEMAAEVDDAIDRGAKYIVLSDRDSTNDLAPIPSLLMLSNIHHHLIRKETRLRVGLIVEAGDVREVHHVALLIGYGASAINPYLAMETAEQLVRIGVVNDLSAEQAVANIITALGKGVLKAMSKMGISVVSSYAGAQTFEALGLAPEFVEQYFTGTVSRLGGVGIEVVAAENLARHRRAYPDEAATNVHEHLTPGGEYQWRRGGPPHLFNPDTVFRLQHSTRNRRYDIFREYSALVNEQSAELMTLRGLLRIREGDRPPVPLEEVESVSSIVRRFSTGAMSFGSISEEAHETLAVAMNSLGAKSNTGEGGETPERLGDPKRRSAIKQVASARFGVTSTYLTNATDIQIKMAQGAKPGEGGQLPPSKVYPWIARTRHSTAGVGLISPPPHHDIYSIEDLKQLIYDLKRANPAARIHVKLVSESGIGAVASGVVKALADVILVSGHDGGTGASPLSSLKHAGTPWELGLAETQQTLMRNGLRDRVVVQVDGQLKTGRDVIIAALLGAEEFGFATAPLVVSGCVMMRVCHLNTCPVGVATQDPELRERFTGRAEFVVNFFEFIAEEIREHLAALGFRTLQEIVGHRDLLDVRSAVSHWKAHDLDLSPIISRGKFAEGEPVAHGRDQDHQLEQHCDQRLIQLSQGALNRGERIAIPLKVKNTDRAVGTMLGNYVTRQYGEAGLPDGTITISLTGTAGQSLGAFIPRGITLHVEGDANDYVGKGLSGGIISLRPSRESCFTAANNVIAGNVIGYGATSGSLFISGIVGERFLVRNSGATAVVEGVGDHALEYMTGGVAVILGHVGQNLAAGMSGGTAYVYRLTSDQVNREALHSGEIRLDPLESSDIESLRLLLTEHAERTGSVLAASMLSDFSQTAAAFVRVIPRDFAAVVRTRAAAIDEGLDPDSPVVWNRILEVTGA